MQDCNQTKVWVLFGLVVGKPIGILGAVLLAMAFKIAKIPEGTNLWQFLGIGFICGIGYTMSIFIAGLAYSNPAIIDSSKIAVLTASLIAAIAGFLFVYLTTHSKDTKDDLIAASSKE